MVVQKVEMLVGSKGEYLVEQKAASMVDCLAALMVPMLADDLVDQTAVNWVVWRGKMKAELTVVLKAAQRE